MRHFKWLFPLLIFALIIGFLPQIASIPPIRTALFNALGSATHMRIEADQMQLSWLGPQRFSNLRLQLPILAATIDKLEVEVPLWSLHKLSRLDTLETIQGIALLENGTVSLALEPPIELSSLMARLQAEKGTTNFSISANTAQSGETGSLALEGNAEKLKDFISDFSIDAHFNHVPTSLIAYFLTQKTSVETGTLIESLGNFVSLNGSANAQNNQGNLDLTLSSEHASGEMHATISEGLLTLKAPLTASLYLTPQLSRSLLSRVNPLFITAIRAKNPISLRIEPDRFSCPIFPLQLKDMQIGLATLDLGKLTCYNGSGLSVISSVLKSPLQTQTINVWFAPLFFSYQNGILNPKRLDALIGDRFPICVFGTIDIARDAINMTLGLTAEALYQAFNIQGLSKNAIIAIPITGSTSNPEFSTGPAVARIAALMTAQTIPTGKFPGKVLKIFAQPDTQPPPPATRPLPWER